MHIVQIYIYLNYQHMHTAVKTSFVSSTKDTGKTVNTLSKTIVYIKRHAAIIPFTS